MRKLTLPSFFAFTKGNNLRARAMKTLFLTLLFGAGGFSLQAAVVITTGSGGTGICSNLAANGTTPGYTTLGSIVVQEGAGGGVNNGDMAAGVNTVVFNAPAGWQFNPASAISIPFIPGRNITSITLVSLTATTLTFDVNVTGVAQRDGFQVNGLEVRAVTTGAANGSVVASVSAGSINGLPTSNMADLSLNPATTPGVTIAASPSNVVCAGVMVTFTPTPSSAVAPTYNWFLNGFSQGISPTFSYVPTNGDNVQAQMTSNGTCETNSTPFSNNINMTVNARPSSTASATPNPVCENGSITLMATASPTGTAPFTYSWSGPGYSATGQNSVRAITPLSGAGTYSVAVTDFNGCTSVAPGTTVVGVSANPTIIANATPASLCVGQNLTLNSTPAGGSGSYTTFSWSGPGGFSASSQNTANTNITTGGAGVYSVTVTDNLGCTSTNPGTTVSVVVNNLPTITATAVPTNICVGNTLALTSIPAGGSGGYVSYSWTGPNAFAAATQNTSRPNIALADAGVYSVTVTDGNGCTSVAGATASVAVNANPTISAGAAPNPVCQGQTLNLTSTPVGGALPYAGFAWSGPAGYTSGLQNTSRTNIPLAGAGTYTVVVTDNNTCVGMGTVVVGVNSLPTITASATPNPICVGQDLTLTSIPAGGGGGYASFSWTAPGGFTASSQNTSNSNITLAGAGAYSVTVTDGNGCTSATPGVTTAVVVNSLPSIFATATPTNICVGNTLTLNSTPSGGSGTYSSFSWSSPGGFTASVQNTTNSNITLAGAGVYSVTVTDNNGCTSAPGTTALVTVNTNPTITATASPNPACVGNTLTLGSTPAGGSGTYTTFAWTGPNSFGAGTQNTTRPSLVVADAGVYSVTVTDNNGCIGRGVTLNVPVNTNPTIAAFATPTSICVGATLTLQSVPSGGSGVYPTYSWTSPGGFTSASQNTTNPAITLAGAGVYSVVVTDNNGCISAPGTTTNVVVHTNPTITANATPNPICVGNTLNLSSTPAGGSGVYSTFAWNGPSFTAGTQNATNANITLAGLGVYSVTVTDNFGCMGMGTSAAVVVFDNPSIVVATATPNPICVGNTLNLNTTPAGGSGVYTTYSWSGPAGYTAATQVATRPTVATTAAGVYSVVVTDDNGCFSAPGTTPAVVVNTLPTITASAAPNPICEGSNLALTSSPAGGNGSYVTYSWSGPNGFTSAGQNPSIVAITTAAAGVYSVNVTDGNGCTSAAPGTTASLVVNTLPTATVFANPNPLCVGSTLNLTATPAGGSGTYSTYAWSGPDGFTSALQNPSIAAITTAAAGVYSLTVSDNNGCTSLPVTTSFVTVNTNPTVGTATATPNPICEGSTLNLNATGAGGSGTYIAYSWSGPAGYTAATQAATRASITTAGAGAYSVIVTDNNGCVSAPGATPAVVVNTQPTITANATPNPLCTGATLALSSTPAGGNGSYITYSWTGPNGFVAATQNPSVPTVSAASAGVYSVNVTDGNGCTSAAPGTTATVVIWALPTVAVGATPNPLCESATLALTATPGGGSGTYTNYAWNGPNGFTSVAQNPSVTPVTLAGAGTYSVVVTDNNGCTSMTGTSPLIIVNSNPSIIANAAPNPICEGNTINLTSTPTGGTLPYVTFAWSGPTFTAATQNTNRTNIPMAGAGVYSVTVTDVNGCSGTGSVNVVVNANPTVTATAAPNPICEGNTLNLNATPAGGSGVYSSFSWTGPGGYTAGTQAATRPNIAVIGGAGSYNVTVVDNNGCSGSGATATVVVNANPIITANATPNPICVGSTLTLTGGASGGTPPYASYSWTGPNSYSATVTTSSTTIPAITTAGAGVYSVTVSDNNGCMASAVTPAVIVNTNPVIATAVASPNPICSGANLGLTSSATGGSGTYTAFSWAGPGGFTATTQNATYVGIPTGGAGVYSVNVTDNNGCTSAAPGTTASVVVNASPTIVVSATPNPICEGNNTLTLNSTPSGGSGTYVSYAWSGPLAFTATTQNTSISPVTPANSGVYNVTVTDNNGCFGSGLSNVTVNPLPVVFTVTGGGPYCTGGTGVAIGLSGSEVGVDYTLYFGSSVAGTASGTGSAISFGSFTAAGATYTVSATNMTTGCNQPMNGNTSVTILPLPVQHTVTGGGSYCLNGPGVPVGLNMSEVGFTYQLYLGAATAGAPVAGTGAAITFGLHTAVGTYTVLATNDFTGCQNVMSNSVTISTLPLPNDHTVVGGGVGCDGTAFHVQITGSDFGIDYQLYNGGTTVGAAVPGNGGGIDFGLFTAAGTYTVLATNTVTGCQAVMSGQADFVIYPLPTVFAVSGGGGYCIGDPGVAVGLTGSESGVEYQLYNGSTPVGAPVAGTGSAISFGAQFTAGTYSVSATNTSTFCTNNMSGSTIVVPNTPPSVFTVSGSSSYCQGGTGVPAVLSGSEAGIVYTVTDGITTVLTGTGDGSAPFTIGNVTAAGTFSVVATNPGTTCFSNMTGDITVTIDPLPLDQAITGGGTRCASDPALSIDLASSEAGVSYQLFLAGVAQSAAIPGPGAINFGSFTAAGTYTVQATNTGTGCNTVLAGSAVIIVNPLPAAITGPSNVCEGAMITLADVDGPGVWNTDNPTVATVDPTTGVVLGITAGTANISYTLTTGCTITTPVTVDANPSAITGSSSVCVGATVGLGSTPAGGFWTNSTPSVATVDINTGVVTGVAAGTDDITYNLPSGCFTTRVQTVNALPVLPVITATATSVCEGATVNYFNSLLGGTWSSSNPSVATVNTLNGTVTGVLAGSATITYGYTNVSGCSNTITQAVTVNPSPGISPITGANSVCSGATAMLSNVTAGGVWSSDNNAIATVNSTTGDVAGVSPGITSISYTVTNLFGCSISAVHALQVGNLLPATAVLPVGSATTCGGNPVNLSVVSSGTLTYYQWVLDGLDILGANTDTYSTVTPGFYQITIGDGSCTQTLTAGTNILAAPNPVILYDTVNNILYTGSFTTYQWFYNGVAISGSNSSLITPTGDGAYAVVVTDANGCSDTATFQLGAPVGVTNTNTVMNVRIYPNPVSSTLFIDAPGKVFVTVLSTDGKMLIERQEAVSINVNQLADGMYMILVHDANGVLVKTDKFIKKQ